MDIVRTFDAIDEQNLKDVLQFSKQELQRFLEKVGKPAGKYGVYRDRLVAVCLVQGAAQHFVDTHLEIRTDHEVVVPQYKIEEKGYQIVPDGRVINGVKDIDVIFFFRDDLEVPIPKARHCKKSTEHALTSLGRRRFDFMKKGIRLDVLGLGDGTDPALLVRCYLTQTDHGRRYLSKKSVVGLLPPSIFGHPLWASRRLTSRSGGRATPAFERDR